MKAYLAQIDGWSGTTATSLTLASHDDESLCHLNGQTWLPAIERLPVMRYDFFDGDFSGQIVAPTGAMVVRTEGLAGFAALALHDARIRVWQGDLGAAWGGFTLLIDGRIEQQPEIADGVAQIGLGVDDSWLDKPFLALYAGTGGIEGGVDLKGTPKPRLFGAPRFTDAVLVDAVNNIWQLSDGAINQVETAFDRLSRFGASAGDHASFAALSAATIAPGNWATCLASGLVRFGAPGDGLIAFHARGDSGGTAGWVRKPGAIIGRIAEIMGASAKVNAASLTALDAARPWNISLAVREQTTPRELILSIAQSVVASPVIDWLGQLYVLPVPVPQSATPVGTLAADGTALPPVESVAQQPVSPPFWRVAQQAEVTQRVHADSEIASIDFASAADVAAAQAAADAAQADADAALTTLTNIASDSLLTPDEKPRVIQDRDAITAEQAGIDAQASAFSITTEKTTYDTAVSALTSYLATLTSPVLWSNLTGNTTIVGATFRQKFLDVYAARQALLNKIAAEAAKRADLALGSNLVVNSEFTNGLTGWTAGWDGNTGLPVTRGIDHVGYFGTKRVAYAYVTGTPAAGTVFDAHYSMGPGVSNLDQCRKWAVPVLPGERIYYSELVAGHRCNVFANLQYRDVNGDYHSEVGSAQAPVAGPNFANGDPANATRVGAFHTVPNGARFAFLNVRGVCPGGQANPYIFHTDGFIAKVDPNQTVPPVYTMGPGDRRATEGAPSGTLVAGVSADTVATATTNFNASNDRNSAAVTAPTIATDGTAVDHTLQSNGSADISFEWSWGGTEGDIDGFLVYLYQSSSASAYTFGTTPAAETVFTLPANKRAFILFGTAPNQYYSFAVQAYRSVDKDINAAGAIKSTLVKATGGGENPYRPSASVAFAGDVTGTVSGTSAATVASGAGKANNGLDSSGNVLTDKVSTDAIVDNGVTQMYDASNGASQAGTGNYSSGGMQTLASFSVTVSRAADLYISSYLNIISTTGTLKAWAFILQLNGSDILGGSGTVYSTGGAPAKKASVAAGTHTITLKWNGGDASVQAPAGGSTLIVDRRYK